MRVDLEIHPDGTILPVRAHAAARKNEIRGEQAGLLKVSVTQSPEKGKANKAILALLAKQLGLKKSQIDLVSGETSPQKKFLIRGVAVQDVQERIRPFVSDAPEMTHQHERRNSGEMR